MKMTAVYLSETELSEIEVKVLRILAGQEVEGVTWGAAFSACLEPLAGRGFISCVPPHRITARGMNYLAELDAAATRRRKRDEDDEEITGIDTAQERRRLAGMDSRLAAAAADMKRDYLAALDEIDRLEQVVLGAGIVADRMGDVGAENERLTDLLKRAHASRNNKAAEIVRLRGTLAPALAACRIIVGAARAGHESADALLMHLLTAVDDARAALSGSEP